MSPLTPDRAPSLLSDRHSFHIFSPIRRSAASGALLLLQLERQCASLAWTPGRGCEVAGTAPDSAEVHMYDLEVTQVGV